MAHTTVRQVKQISVTVYDVPGSLAQLAQALARANVNLEGFAQSNENPDRTVTDRFVTEDFDAAKRVLTDLGASFTEQMVLELHNPDKPGVLAKVAGVLGNADINIESIYFSTPGARNDTNVYIGVSPHKLAEAEKLLHGLEH